MTEGAKPQSALERIFFISDPHIPYHDQRALDVALKAMRGFRPSIVVSVGDFVDFFSVSNYSKDPARALQLDKEIGQANVILDRIEKVASKARRIYIAGNHEDRLQRYLHDKAPELVPFIDVEKLLHLRERGWKYVAYKNSIKLGKVYLTHDVGSAGRYNAYKALDSFQASVVTGHTHRLAYVVEGSARGDAHVSAQFGWLGDVKQIDYMHLIKAQRDWALGFGYGYLRPDTGHVFLVPAPIVSYQAVVEGKLYST